MTIQFHRNPEGVQQILNGAEMLTALRRFADPAAREVQAAHPDAEVVVDDYKAREKGRFTERHATSIKVLDVRGKAWQARDGLLTKAAANQGLEVTER